MYCMQITVNIVRMWRAHNVTTEIQDVNLDLHTENKTHCMENVNHIITLV